MSEDATSMLHRQLFQDNFPDEAGGYREASTSESVASQRTNRMIPDRSAKPLGDTTAGRRSRPPYEDSSHGEGPHVTQSTKRPLPDSPPSRRKRVGNVEGGARNAGNLSQE